MQQMAGCMMKLEHQVESSS